LIDSLLITGPPASGKSHLAIARFLDIPESRLIVPTATMAEHVRNQLARSGAAVRPARIVTLAQFVASSADSRPASAAMLHSAIRHALETLRPARFQGVIEYRGFHQALADLIEEIPTDQAGGDLIPLFQEVERTLAVRGLALRKTRVNRAAGDPRDLPDHIVFDGFFDFSEPELRLLERLKTVTVTLPDWPGSLRARQKLLSRGFAEHRCEQSRRSPRTTAFAAATLERETEEIARRILHQANQGRQFREMGIILRSRDPYAPALDTSLARFGIPARFYFADPLIAHPAIAYLSGIMRALLDGWDHHALLSLLQTPISGFGATPAGDRFDFAFREQLPGKGLPVRGVENAPTVLDSLQALKSWSEEIAEAPEWARRIESLRALLPEPILTDQVDRVQFRAWRSTAAALDAFDAALDETAVTLDGRIRLAHFWRQAEMALSLEPLRVPDRRHNVVHVLDVFEARQWELPVVFVCGLSERHFPQYHREDSLFNDAARRRASLKTSADLQREERFLFEFATSRSSEETILSCARFNEKGEDVLPSFFLSGSALSPCDTRVRPRPSRAIPAPRHASIRDTELLDRLAGMHKALGPTPIESFLQCPFQFFAARTLRLRPRPAAPADRLDVLLQGSILHRALAEWTRMPLLGAAIFDSVFEDECRRAHIPQTYRTEAVRLELLRNFEGFLADRKIRPRWASRVEEQFNIPLSPLLSIRGRIDRIDVGPRKEALVIDYKYSAAAKIRERVDDHAGGNLVQGGLYLLAAEKQFGLDPAGMLFCGLRKEVVWDGWHRPIPGLESIGESCTPALLRDLMNSAAAKATEVFESITSGRIAPAPSDTDKCRWCDFRDICRVETAAAIRKAKA
jgi:ATP-dependent helicase/DNAse subunit B